MSQFPGEVRQLQQMLGLIPTVPNKPIPDFFFICIDCEAFENAQHKITEIGISVLDSRSLATVSPGADGQPWFGLMKHLHLRPIEYRNLVNKRYIKGCPDSFNFGTGEFKPLREVGIVLKRVFSDPARIHEACDFDVKIDETSPKIVLVGHDLRNDTEYLKRFHFEPQNVVAKLDTQRLARSSKRDQPGLKRLCAALGVEVTNLHNAGNDAAYTLQCLVSLGVREYAEKGVVAKMLEAERVGRLGAKAREVKDGKKPAHPAANAALAAAKPAAKSTQPIQHGRLARPSDILGREPTHRGALPSMGGPVKLRPDTPHVPSSIPFGDPKASSGPTVGSRRPQKIRRRQEEQDRTRSDT